jgi:putative hydrolase of the HAD superfamily
LADLKHKKHLFFDFDDTLWDFKKNSTLVLEQLFVEFELENKLKTNFDGFQKKYMSINLEFWSKYYKRQIDKDHMRNHRFNAVFKSFGYDNYEENLVITEHYLTRAPHGTFLKEGCTDTLDYLKQNYQLHIITNGFKESQSIKLNACGIKNYFSQIIIADEHAVIKPEKEIFRLAESLAGAAKDECVMIGDSLESDVNGAINAGWEAIYYSENPSGDFEGKTIGHLSELKEIF